MKFYKNLYIGDTVKKPERLIRKLRRHKIKPGFFVIAYMRDTARLEICSSVLLAQWYYKDNPPGCIVGLANGREEALSLIERIAGDALAATGKVSLVEYLAQTDPESFSAQPRKTAMV
ncbi:MAG: hypothetical protein K2O59_05665 [Lachnospiraceae bacterium]|nr:hypothetical protein [Lachnospiraceae bacterium]